ncbi:MAG: sigma-70 family RNA polymerase sigma factor [Ruminococcus flavefaciens]|nr:sigma-70 family RNA polymerase sigma factor [Ruminococcus flavefaciens]
MNHPESEKDLLRGRFTRWLNTTIYRARIDYIRKNSQDYEIVSIDELSEDVLITKDDENHWIHNIEKKSAFDFEEEKLANAFYELPLMRQQILTMLFVEDKNSEEIAAELHCSVQHIYNQRSLAIKKLRTMLDEGGDEK